MSAGKGSARRPGENYADNFAATFGKERCEVVSDVDCRTCAWFASSNAQCLNPVLCLQGAEYRGMLAIQLFKVAS